jgi:hypothetical protein
MKIATALLTIFFTPGTSFAACEDVLRYINYNTTYNYSQLTTDQINQASLCSEEYKNDTSAKSIQIQASYELFTGHAAASADDVHQEQQKICGSKYGRDFLASLNIQQTQIVSDEAVSALKSCYDASEFHLQRLTALGNTLSADFKYGGVGKIAFNGVIIGGGKDTAQCTIKYHGNTYEPKQSFTIDSGDSITIGCDRTEQPISSPTHQANYVRYKEGLVTVSTQSEGVAIPLVEVVRTINPDSRVSDIDTRLHNIENSLPSQMHEVSNRLGAAEGTIAATKATAAAANDLATGLSDILLDGKKGVLQIMNAESMKCLGAHDNPAVQPNSRPSLVQDCTRTPIDSWILKLERGQ